MRWIVFQIFLTAGAILLAPSGRCAPVEPPATLPVAEAGDAQRPSEQPRRGPHGGLLHAVDPFRCEIVFSDRVVRIYIADRDGKAVATRGVRGRLSLREKGSRQQRHYDLYPTVDRASGDPCLRADVNFTKIRNGDATASVVIHRLNPSGQPPLRVSEAFRRTPPPDVIAIQRQLVCPVSGKILVAEPKTVKVRAGDVVVYVCCQGCASTVRLAPEKYIKRLAKLPPPGKGSPK